MEMYSHKEAVEFLNDKYWHDSVLYEIRVIRTKKSRDQVKMYLDLITDENKWECQRTTLTFHNCYYTKIVINGGVICLSDAEMIDYATANLSAPLIDQVIKEWDKLVALSGLFHFSMVLASTGSEIDIVCRDVSVSLEKDIEKHRAPPQLRPTPERGDT